MYNNGIMKNRDMSIILLLSVAVLIAQHSISRIPFNFFKISFRARRHSDHTKSERLYCKVWNSWREKVTCTIKTAKQIFTRYDVLRLGATRKHVYLKMLSWSRMHCLSSDKHLTGDAVLLCFRCKIRVTIAILIKYLNDTRLKLSIFPLKNGCTRIQSHCNKNVSLYQVISHQHNLGAAILKAMQKLSKGESPCYLVKFQNCQSCRQFEALLSRGMVF